MKSDAELLHAYATDGSEEAFRQLVERHIGFVYGVALRKTQGDAQLAQDVAQGVFSDVARKAALLKSRPSLGGWLFTSARFTAAKLMRSERRRARYERDAHALLDLNTTDSNPLDWRRVSPFIDESLDGLSAADREAVILRFFHAQSFSAIGSQLAITDDGARLRVQRALDKIRSRLRRHGISCTADAIAIAIAPNGVTAAPAGTVEATVALALRAGSSGIVAAGGASAFTFMTTKTAIGLTLLAASAVGVYLHITQISELRAEISQLEKRNARMAAQYHEAQQRWIAARQTTVESAKAAQRLRADATPTGTGTDLAKIKLLTDYLTKYPQLNIPDLGLLQPLDWLTVVTNFPLDDETSIRAALAELRLAAKKRLGPQLAEAMKAYLAANNQVLPSDPTALAHFLPGVAPEILARYKMVVSGNASNALKGTRAEPVLMERDRVDETDSELRVGALGDWGWSSGPEPSLFQRQLQAARKLYQEAHPGSDHPLDRAEVRSYIDPSADREQLEYWIATGHFLTKRG